MGRSGRSAGSSPSSTTRSSGSTSCAMSDQSGSRAQQPHGLGQVGREDVGDGADDRVLAQRPRCRGGAPASPRWMPTGTIVAPGWAASSTEASPGAEPLTSKNTSTSIPSSRAGRRARRSPAFSVARGAERGRELEPLLVQVDDEHPRARRGRGDRDERADAADPDDDRVLAGPQSAAPHGVHRDRHRLGEAEGVERESAVA